MSTIKVENCQACPFTAKDNLYWYYKCNLSEAVTASLKSWELLPVDKVHELCPLKSGAITVELKKD